MATVFSRARFSETTAVVLGNLVPAYGIEGSFLSKPVGICQLSEGLACLFENLYKSGSGTLIPKGCVVVPLGIPDMKEGATSTVLQQVARMFVSGGGNTAAMSNDNVLHMYYCALQSLVYAVGSATSTEEQVKWAVPMVQLTRALASLHSHIDLFQKVSGALVVTPGADDVLQRCLAFVFVPSAASAWTKELRLGMLVTMLRRAIRNDNKVNTTNLATVPGPFVVLTLVPLLRRVIADDDDTESEDVVAAFVSRLNALFPAGKPLKGGEPPAVSMQRFTAIVDCALTLEQTRKLLKFCTDPRVDMGVEPDWREWGVEGLEPRHALVVPVRTDKYVLQKHVPRSTTYKCRLTASSSKTFSAVSFKGTEWTAFELPSQMPNVYVITTTPLGQARPGLGVTAGKALVANFRVTSGPVVFPENVDGYSSAGQKFSQDKSTRAWGYTQSTPVVLLRPFTLAVAKGGIYTLTQEDTTFLHTTCAPGANILFAFKNMTVEVAIGGGR
jgi:hypothetical protein